MATFKFGNAIVKVNGDIDKQRVEKAACLFLNKIILKEGDTDNVIKNKTRTINKK